MQMPHRTMTVAEAAAYLHLSEDEVTRLARKNRIPYEKVRDRIVFRSVELEAWASRRLLDTRHGDEKFSDDFHKRSSETHYGATNERQIMPHLITPERIEPQLGAKTRSSVLSEMTMLAGETGLVNDPVDLLETLRSREDLCSTALPGGIALLHPRHHHEYLFEDSFIVLGRAGQPVPFGAPDGKLTDLFFLICCGDDKLHLHMLARLASMCHATNLIAGLRVAETALDMYDLIIAAEVDVIVGMNR
jgi:PTS system nitrogen regulatory IIA component